MIEECVSLYVYTFLVKPLWSQESTSTPRDRIECKETGCRHCFDFEVLPPTLWTRCSFIYFIPEDDSSVFFDLWRTGSALRNETETSFVGKARNKLHFQKFPLVFLFAELLPLLLFHSFKIRQIVSMNCFKPTESFHSWKKKIYIIRNS